MNTESKYSPRVLFRCRSHLTGNQPDWDYAPRAFLDPTYHWAAEI